MEEILKGLQTLVSGQVIEIRAIPPIGEPAIFAPDDLDKAAKWAARLSGSVMGVYVTLNPLTQDPLLDGANAEDKTVLKRRWLPIDLDPVREADVSATDAEKAAALDRRCTVRKWLAAQGWAEPVVMDSGNGYWLLYAIDMPNDEDSKRLVHDCLKALAAKFDDERVTIDKKIANASRIGKLPGTLACKGTHTEDRPHRVAALLEVPPELVPVPREKLEELAAQRPQERPAQAATSAAEAVTSDSQQPQEWASVEERIARAKAYAEKVEPAISGQHGHDQTYYVAALLVATSPCPSRMRCPLWRNLTRGACRRGSMRILCGSSMRRISSQARAGVRQARRTPRSYKPRGSTQKADAIPKHEGWANKNTRT